MATSQWYTKTKVDQLLANAGGTTDYNALTNKPTLGTAAAQNSSAFDAAGAANAVAASVAISYVTKPVAGTTPGYIATVGSDGKSITYSAPTGGGGSASDNGVGGISSSSSSTTDNGLGGIAA